jgi:endonuclease/exonuclease/phosphatase family metal-dependent hydrolase
MLNRKWLGVLAFTAMSIVSAATSEAQDIVLYPSDVSNSSGNWYAAQSASGAGGQRVTSDDYGWSSVDVPLANPSNYFEATFSAPAYTTYHVWLRLRAGGDSKWNDSVWVQFSDSADTNGSAAYRIGSGDALLVNLEPCNNCGVSGWGWADKGYWTGQSPLVTFANRGTHTIRVQTREDGVQVDQIVLSPANYLNRAPGQGSNDGTILARSTDGGSASAADSSSSVSAYLGSAISLPGTVNAQDYDNGPSGTSYSDTTRGNTGGAYRGGDVDLESSDDGGNNIGWTDPGEWVNYTVNVASGGNYTLQVRVSSATGGGTMHVGFNKSNVWKTVSVPGTGGWQRWTTVNVPVTLTSGTQVLTVLFDTGGVNLNRIGVSSGSGSSGSSSSSSSLGPFGGSAWSIPGTVQAEDFDEGGEGVAYHDKSAGNSGGTYRNSDVDIEASAGGGYDVGWTSGGEFLNYTVNVASGGNYTAQVRVASASGASLHLGFNGPSNVWTSVPVSSTGGWQTWTTINVPVSLGAGRQVMTLMVDSGSINLDEVKVVAGSLSSSPPSSGGGGGSSYSASGFRMLTWNIHSGIAENGSYVLPEQVQYMASQGADVIVLQEVSIYNEDQPSKFKSLIQQATGQTWYSSWAPSCSSGGCLGNLILSRIPIVSQDMIFITPSAVARAELRINNIPVQIFTNHLDYYDTGVRTRELYQLMDWARSFSSGARLVAGDFNSWWGEWWISQMLAEYSDTWQDVSGNRDGAYTIGNVRFDYIFRAYQGNGHVTPRNAWVGQTSLSDHRPFIADFSVQ